MEYTIIATATFGLEKVVANELKELGYDELKIENGKVTFTGNERDIAICNIWLRTADRILINMAEFKAESFEDLFQGTVKVEWGDLIPQDGIMHVTGKSIKSLLHSVPDCQSIVKKAVIESMKRKYETEWFEENASVYKIEVGILKDIVTLTVDTTGPGLHKRGYREEAGEAPLKETLAAALVLLTKWDTSKILADPFCGSGTIPIEAAMIAKNIAPGLYRSFVSEEWPNFNKKVWTEVRRHAHTIINDKEITIYASDIDKRVLNKARDNARNAGVSECIYFKELPVAEFGSTYSEGVIVCNPPYGERLLEEEEIKILYKSMGEVFSKLNNWSNFILTAHPDFHNLFGKKADKNRKLYNGKLLCYYYQYKNKIVKS
jgi:putative N6-adenine-specific DNA methylase